jgi:hypothetical protein
MFRAEYHRLTIFEDGSYTKVDWYIRSLSHPDGLVVSTGFSLVTQFTLSMLLAK